MIRALTAAYAALLLVLCACSGGSGNTTVPATPRSSNAFTLVPSPVELTSDAPVAVVNAQGDIAGVAYTPHASADCTATTGSISIAGDGVAQTDVAGSPLMFVALATGTPPSTCTLTVTGSNGTIATAQMTYEQIVISTGLQSQERSTAASPIIVPLSGTITPSPVTINRLDQLVKVNASAFTGQVTVKTACTGTGNVSASPATFSGTQTVTIVAYGQGALTASCSAAFTDASGATVNLPITLAVKALAKFTASPASVEFACSGTVPQSCDTTQPVTLQENGAAQFNVATRPVFKGTCAKGFEGPPTMTTGNGVYSLSVAGPQTPVTFAAVLPATTLSCTTIYVSDGGAPAQRVAIAVSPRIASGAPQRTPPPCGAADPYVAAPNAPHGMYVWNPYSVEGGKYQSEILNKVVGKDPTLCGASILVMWNEVESNKGSFDWSKVETQALPYVSAGLRVNLLFIDSSETGTAGSDSALPAWVHGTDGVAMVSCPSTQAQYDQPDHPNYMDPTFEKDWDSVITAAVQHFSSPAAYKYASQIGYMRFGIGMGSEALPGHLDYPGCYDQWVNTAGFTYDKWVQHAKNIVNFMATLQPTTSKQLMVALNAVPEAYIPSSVPTPNPFYDYPNTVARVAAAAGIGFGTENLGIAHVADAGSVPGACGPSAGIINLYWCQAFTRHVGTVPFEFQPICATTPDSPTHLNQYPNIDFANLLQYALDNNAQILELYPQEWVAADDPASISGVSTQEQSENRAALNAAAQILGTQSL